MEIRKSAVAWQLAIAVGLVVAGVVLRLLPHVPNVAPVGAIALFGGAMFGWRLAIWLPLVTMMISDAILGFYPGIAYTWAGFLAVVLYGMLLRRSRPAFTVLIGGLGSSVLFFIISNFGVWLSSGMYPATLAGLLQCYVAGLPFFRATLIGDLFYCFVLFGAYEAAWRTVRAKLLLAPSPR